MSAATAGRGRRWVRDPRLWIGLAVTAGTLWLALRGVDFRILVRDMGRANLWLLFGLSVPLYLLQFWVRALRWRHLTDAVCPASRGALFRATAVGFMANNVFPLRIGEVVRAWYLAREMGARTTPVFGTVVLERVIDAVVVLALASAVLGVSGAQGRGDGTLAVGIPLIVSAMIPLAGVILLRVAPERIVRLISCTVGRLLPLRVTETLEDLLRRLAEGLRSLQGGRHLVWVAWHSLVIWLVLGSLPFVVGFAALGIEFESVWETFFASYMTLVAVGVAVALPSAPGFFGPYHLACRAALSRFGVSEEMALALGTLAHAVFWLTSTLLGLLALRLRATPLHELGEVAAEETQRTQLR